MRPRGLFKCKKFNFDNNIIMVATIQLYNLCGMIVYTVTS